MFDTGTNFSPYHPGVKALHPPLSMPSAQTCGLLRSVVGRGELCKFDTGHVEPFGYYRMDPENGDMPLFIKIVPTNRIEKELSAADIARYLAADGVPVSAPIGTQPWHLEEKMAVFVYPHITGNFAMPEAPHLEAIGAKLACMHRSMQSITDTDHIQRRTRQRSDSIVKAWEKIVGGSVIYSPEADETRRILTSFTPAALEFRDCKQVIHGDLHHGNILICDSNIPLFLDFEDALSSWLPRSVDVAMVLERFVLVHEENDSEAFRLGEDFLRAYLDESTNHQFQSSSDLEKAITWLTIRGLVTLNQQVELGIQVPNSEWSKFIGLARMAEKRKQLIRELGDFLVM